MEDGLISLTATIFQLQMEFALAYWAWALQKPPKIASIEGLPNVIFVADWVWRAK